MADTVRTVEEWTAKAEPGEYLIGFDTGPTHALFGRKDQRGYLRRVKLDEAEPTRQRYRNGGPMLADEAGIWVQIGDAAAAVTTEAREAFLDLIADAKMFHTETDGDETGQHTQHTIVTADDQLKALVKALGIKQQWGELTEDAISRAIDAGPQPDASRPPLASVEGAAVRLVEEGPEHCPYCNQYWEDGHHPQCESFKAQALAQSGRSSAEPVAWPPNWNDANDPWVKLFVGYDINEYLSDYEFRGDNGDYTPNEADLTLLHDAIAGVVGELHEKAQALATPPVGRQEADDKWRHRTGGGIVTELYRALYQHDGEAVRIVVFRNQDGEISARRVGTFQAAFERC